MDLNMSQLLSFSLGLIIALLVFLVMRKRECVCYSKKYLDSL